MNRLLEALRSGRVLLMDGAMGTELQRLGLADPVPERAIDDRDYHIQLPERSEAWNLRNPERVCSVHRAYLEAGAEVLLTNIFQANPNACHQAGLPIREVWEAALRHARFFGGPPPFVLADVGPVVEPSEPMRIRRGGNEEAVQLDLCRRADGLLLETFNARNPISCTVAIIDETKGPERPLLLSFAFKGDSLTRRTEAVDCAHVAKMLGASALGANCGAEMDIDDLLEIVQVYRRHTELPLFVRPNAGTPVRTASGWEYPRSPEYMTDKLWPLLEAGVTMVGGCCGTTPAHIAAFRRVVDEWNARKRGK